MARTRSIKPSFFSNDILAECEPMARLLFAGLWTLADRDGRLEYRPRRIKGALFPYDNCDIGGRYFPASSRIASSAIRRRMGCREVSAGRSAEELCLVSGRALTGIGKGPRVSRQRARRLHHRFHG